MMRDVSQNKSISAIFNQSYNNKTGNSHNSSYLMEPTAQNQQLYQVDNSSDQIIQFANLQINQSHH